MVARPRVLVVDDEPDVVRSLARMLRAEHDVTGISDPREVVRLAAGGERWDVILCDLMMPYHTGPELHAAVSAIDATLGPRFVFVTGGVLREEVTAALETLPNAVLAKPVELATLREAVRRARRG